MESSAGSCSLPHARLFSLDPFPGLRCHSLAVLRVEIWIVSAPWTDIKVALIAVPSVVELLVLLGVELEVATSFDLANSAGDSSRS